MSALVNPAFWLVAAFTAGALLKPHGVAAPRALRIATLWPVLSALCLIAAANVAARALIGHAVPGDFAQEAVAARAFASQGVWYTQDVNADVREWLTEAPPEVPEWWPSWLTAYLRDRQAQGRNLLVTQAHPPTLLLSLTPFVTMLGASTTYWLLVAVSVAAAILTSQWLLRAWRPGCTPPERVLAAVVLVSWQPALAAFRDGQVSVIIGALGVAAWHALRTSQAAGAGLAAGLGTALKLYPWPFLALFAFRRPRAFFVACALLLTMAGLVTAAAGAGVWAEYGASARIVTRSFAAAPHNLALVARVAALVPPSWLLPAFGVVAMAVCAATVLALGRGRWISREPATLDLDLAIVSTAALLLSPVAWHHYVFLLAQPLAVALTSALRQGQRLWLAAWGTAVLLLSLPDDAVRRVWGWLPVGDERTGLVSPGLVIVALWLVLVRLKWRAVATGRQERLPAAASI